MGSGGDINELVVWVVVLLASLFGGGSDGIIMLVVVAVLLYCVDIDDTGVVKI